MIPQLGTSFEDLFVTPNGLVRVWRYMTLQRFEQMLSNRGLRFASPDDFKEDPFEGSVPRAWSKRQSTQTRELNKAEIPPSMGTIKATRNRTQEDRSGIVINCWHASEHESLAMWKLYAPVDGAVCIRSTCSRLKECLTKEDGIHIGLVKYIDYGKHDFLEGSSLSPYMYKRLSFEHEKELRVICYRDPKAGQPNSPRYLKIDSNKLKVQVRRSRHAVGDGFKITVLTIDLVHDLV
jgi:hypothetical protein